MRTTRAIDLTLLVFLTVCCLASYRGVSADAVPCASLSNGTNGVTLDAALYNGVLEISGCHLTGLRVINITTIAIIADRPSRIELMISNSSLSMESIFIWVPRLGVTTTVRISVVSSALRTDNGRVLMPPDVFHTPHPSSPGTYLLSVLAAGAIAAVDMEIASNSTLVASSTYDAGTTPMNVSVLSIHVPDPAMLPTTRLAVSNSSLRATAAGRGGDVDVAVLSVLGSSSSVHDIVLVVSDAALVEVSALSSSASAFVHCLSVTAQSVSNATIAILSSEVTVAIAARLSSVSRAVAVTVAWDIVNCSILIQNGSTVAATGGSICRSFLASIVAGRLASRVSVLIASKSNVSSATGSDSVVASVLLTTIPLGEVERSVRYAVVIARDGCAVNSSSTYSHATLASIGEMMAAIDTTAASNTGGSDAVAVPPTSLSSLRLENISIVVLDHNYLYGIAPNGAALVACATWYAGVLLRDVTLSIAENCVVWARGKWAVALAVLATSSWSRNDSPTAGVPPVSRTVNVDVVSLTLQGSSNISLTGSQWGVAVSLHSFGALRGGAVTSQRITFIVRGDCHVTSEVAAASFIMASVVVENNLEIIANVDDVVLHVGDACVVSSKQGASVSAPAYVLSITFLQGATTTTGSVLPTSNVSVNRAAVTLSASTISVAAASVASLVAHGRGSMGVAASDVSFVMDSSLVRSFPTSGSVVVTSIAVVQASSSTLVNASVSVWIGSMLLTVTNSTTTAAALKGAATLIGVYVAADRSIFTSVTVIGISMVAVQAVFMLEGSGNWRCLSLETTTSAGFAANVTNFESSLRRNSSIVYSLQDDGVSTTSVGLSVDAGAQMTVNAVNLRLRIDGLSGITVRRQKSSRKGEKTMILGVDLNGGAESFLQLSRLHASLTDHATVVAQPSTVSTTGIIFVRVWTAGAANCTLDDVQFAVRDAAIHTIADRSVTSSSASSSAIFLLVLDQQVSSNAGALSVSQVDMVCQNGTLTASSNNLAVQRLYHRGSRCTTVVQTAACLVTGGSVWSLLAYGYRTVNAIGFMHAIAEKPIDIDRSLLTLRDIVLVVDGGSNLSATSTSSDVIIMFLQNVLDIDINQNIWLSNASMIVRDSDVSVTSGTNEGLLLTVGAERTDNSNDAASSTSLLRLLRHPAEFVMMAVINSRLRSVAVTTSRVLWFRVPSPGGSNLCVVVLNSTITTLMTTSVTGTSGSCTVAFIVHLSPIKGEWVGANVTNVTVLMADSVIMTSTTATSLYRTATAVVLSWQVPDSTLARMRALRSMRWVVCRSRVVVQWPAGPVLCVANVSAVTDSTSPDSLLMLSRVELQCERASCLTFPLRTTVDGSSITCGSAGWASGRLASGNNYSFNVTTQRFNLSDAGAPMRSDLPGAVPDPTSVSPTAQVGDVQGCELLDTVPNWAWSRLLVDYDRLIRDTVESTSAVSTLTSTATASALPINETTAPTGATKDPRGVVPTEESSSLALPTTATSLVSVATGTEVATLTIMGSPLAPPTLTTSNVTGAFTLVTPTPSARNDTITLATTTQEGSPSSPSPLVSSVSVEVSSAESKQAFTAAASLSATTSVASPVDALQAARIFAALRTGVCIWAPVSTLIRNVSGVNSTRLSTNASSIPSGSAYAALPLGFPRTLLPVRLADDDAVNAVLGNGVAICIAVAASLGFSLHRSRGARRADAPQNPRPWRVACAAGRFPAIPLAVAFVTLDGTAYAVVVMILAALHHGEQYITTFRLLTACLGGLILLVAFAFSVGVQLSSRLVWLAENDNSSPGQPQNGGVLQRLCRVRGRWTEPSQDEEPEAETTGNHEGDRQLNTAAAVTPTLFLELYRPVVACARGGDDLFARAARFATSVDVLLTMAAAMVEAWAGVACSVAVDDAATFTTVVIAVVSFLYLLLAAPHPAFLKAVIAALTAAVGVIVSSLLLVARRASSSADAERYARVAASTVMVVPVLSALAILASVALWWRRRTLRNQASRSGEPLAELGVPMLIATVPTTDVPLRANPLGQSKGPRE